MTKITFNKKTKKKDKCRVPLVVHIILRLNVGGMENGLVNLINRSPSERYRHIIICLEDADEFQNRIISEDVKVYSLNNKPGNGLKLYLSLWCLLRKLAPDIVHSRNLPTIDLMPLVWLAGVRSRVHGEHGRDTLEMYGKNKKYNLIRRLVSPLVQCYVPVSKDLANWLVETIGIPKRKIRQVYNGVDTVKFHPTANKPKSWQEFAPPGSIVFGTVGRLETVKDQTTLVQAYLKLCEKLPDKRSNLKLVVVGDGSLMPVLVTLLERSGYRDQVWLPGARDDVPEIMRQIDVFVLPSINEGISNTILEAMASGCPVIATAVGGNVELVHDGETGLFCPPSDPDAMAAVMSQYVTNPALVEQHGLEARRVVLEKFDLAVMVDRYLVIYDELLLSRNRG